MISKDVISAFCCNKRVREREKSFHTFCLFSIKQGFKKIPLFCSVCVLRHKIPAGLVDSSRLSTAFKYTYI